MNHKVPVVVEKEQDKYVPEPSNTDYPLLEDICGSTQLKTDLEDAVFNIKHAELYGMMLARPDKSYLMLGEPGCLVKGTKILTPIGFVNIEDVEEVVSFDINKKQFIIKPCQKLFTKKEVIEITLSDDTIIECSEEHKWFLEDFQEHLTTDLNISSILYNQNDIKKLYNMWKTDERISKSGEDKKDLLMEMSHFKTETNKLDGNNESEGRKESYVSGRSNLKRRSDRIIHQSKDVSVKNIKDERSDSSCNRKQVKDIWDKTKKFQRTSSNRNKKTRTQEEIIGKVQGETKSSIHSWEESGSKSKQEKLSEDSETESTLDMFSLWCKENIKHGFDSTSQRQKYYEQFCRQFNSVMSRMSHKITHNKTIKSIRRTGRIEEMVDLVVPDTNNFFLSNGVLSHNSGKTFSMSAIRNELIKSGMNVMEAPYDIGQYGTAYINMGAVNLQKYFDMLGKYAKQGYCVLSLFDEADSLLSKRGNRMSSHKEDDKLLNCLMKNQQRIHDNTEPIYIIFATNFPEALDEASVRSGRIDKIIKFDLPDEQGLIQGYRTKIAGKNSEFKEKYCKGLLIKHIKYPALAKASAGFNYADIDNVIEKSLKQRVREIIEAPQDMIVGMGYVDQKQLLYQIDRLQEQKQGTKYRAIGF